MDWNDLRDYIGVNNNDEDTYIEGCWDTAVILVAQATKNAFRPIPAEVMDRLNLEVGNELYNRKNAPSGTSQYAVFEGGAVPVRGPRDPLAQVRPIIAGYVVGF